MKIASLDLGSNTFLLFIAEASSQKPYIHKVYRDEIFYTRLGQYIHADKQTRREVLNRIETCFKLYRKIIKEEKVDVVYAVATSAARDMEESQSLVDLGLKYDIPIRIISGQKEAQLSFLGASFDLECSKNIMVIDIGGYSTEVIIRNENTIYEKSLNIGSVRLNEVWQDQIYHSKKGLDLFKKHINEQIKDLKKFSNLKKVIAVAGVPTTLACLNEKKTYPCAFVHKKILSLKSISSWIDTLSQCSASQRIKLIGEEKRADVILAGSCVLERLLVHLELDCVYVSCNGLRQGLALKVANNDAEHFFTL